MDVRRGDKVTVQDRRGNVREFYAEYIDGDYDFSVVPAAKSVTMLNGTTEQGEPVVWRQDSDGGRILRVNEVEFTADIKSAFKK